MRHNKTAFGRLKNHAPEAIHTQSGGCAMKVHGQIFGSPAVLERGHWSWLQSLVRLQRSQTQPCKEHRVSSVKSELKFINDLVAIHENQAKIQHELAEGFKIEAKRIILSPRTGYSGFSDPESGFRPKTRTCTSEPCHSSKSEQPFNQHSPENLRRPQSRPHPYY